MIRKSRNVIVRDLPSVDYVCCDPCAGVALRVLTATVSMFSKRKIPTASYSEFIKKGGCYVLANHYCGVCHGVFNQ